MDLPRLARLPLQSLILVTALLTAFALTPLANRASGAGIFAGLLYLAVICTGGYLLVRNRRWLVAFAIVSIPAWILGVGEETRDLSPGFVLCADLSKAILQLLLFAAVLRFSLYHPAASRADRVLAGIGGYLVLGFFWADLYLAAGHFIADGFQLPGGNTSSLPRDGSAQYFSFVTLSTVGYGDISPVHPWTRMLAALQSVSGTLYLAVFIAALVGRPRRPHG